MFVSHMALNGRHLVMSFCSRGGGKEVALPGVGGGAVRDRDGNNSIRDTLASVTSFKYLEIILSELYEDWPVVVHNLRRS